MKPYPALVSLLFGSSLLACAAPARNEPPPAAGVSTAQRAVLPEALRTDAAGRAQAQPDQVELINRESVTWRDGSLGCPEPDRMYLQVLVPGYRLRVRAGATHLTYHADQRGRWVWCPPERAKEPLGPAN
jgi:hypothetical protein